VALFIWRRRLSITVEVDSCLDAVERREIHLSKAKRCLDEADQLSTQTSHAWLSPNCNTVIDYTGATLRENSGFDRSAVGARR